ncbi:unnamed protein product [Thelazia callipaeda]|uniref:Secreted protein n=1 Tax=Thelazia callipaeda TaxID=103827 RepID=A0A0N5D719_THECL|nr:unnamed protein product [Thelazia callipaeda]
MERRILAILTALFSLISHANSAAVNSFNGNVAGDHSFKKNANEVFGSSLRRRSTSPPNYAPVISTTPIPLKYGSGYSGYWPSSQTSGGYYVYTGRENVIPQNAGYLATLLYPPVANFVRGTGEREPFIGSISYVPYLLNGAYARLPSDPENFLFREKRPQVNKFIAYGMPYSSSFDYFEAPSPSYGVAPDSRLIPYFVIGSSNNPQHHIVNWNAYTLSLQP